VIVFFFQLLIFFLVFVVFVLSLTPFL